MTRIFVWALFLILPALAQRRVGPEQSYERAYAVVPMIGSGTDADPFRPKHAPAGGPALLGSGAPSAPSRDGIIAFTYTLSDDGKFALAVFVAAKKTGLNEVLQDTGIQAFVKGRDKQEDIETAFRKYKKNFKIEELRVAVQ